MLRITAVGSAVMSALAVLLILAGCTTGPISPTAPTPSLPAGVQCIDASVSRVVDGDTIIVRLNGKEERVRYIGVNAPESVDPRRAVQPLGKNASEVNRRLVEGKTVCLEKDVSETDRYSRLLRYVWLGDTLVNAELVRLGYAQAVSYPPDLKRQAFLRQTEREARDMHRGLWALPTPTRMP